MDEKLAFVLKTDVLENAFSAMLNRRNRPLAFFSSMFSKNEGGQPCERVKKGLDRRGSGNIF